MAWKACRPRQPYRGRRRHHPLLVEVARPTVSSAEGKAARQNASTPHQPGRRAAGPVAHPTAERRTRCQSRGRMTSSQSRRYNGPPQCIRESARRRREDRDEQHGDCYLEQDEAPDEEDAKLKEVAKSFISSLESPRAHRCGSGRRSCVTGGPRFTGSTAFSAYLTIGASRDMNEGASRIDHTLRSPGHSG